MSPTLAPTERTTLHRRRSRGVFDRDAIHAILDEALVCHVGFAVDRQPFVLPTTYVRIGSFVYLHAAAAGRFLGRLRAGTPACVTVTLLDGLVLARSAFHHSMNYRSVVILGVATEVTDPEEKLRALSALVERISPGRSAVVRAPSAPELEATTVVRLPIEEASAKVRSGPPIEDEQDLGIPCWAGEIPIRLRVLEPVADSHCAPEAPSPAVPTPLLAVEATS